MTPNTSFHRTASGGRGIQTLAGMSSTQSVAVVLATLGSPLWRAGPASSQAVAQLERELAVVLPPSYKGFLLQFGAVALGDCTVSGIVDNNPLSPEGGSLVGDTQRLRAERGLPSRYLVVQADEDAPYCFDTHARRQDGELSVVCYELHSGHVETIADSFAEWTMKFFVPSAQ